MCDDNESVWPHTSAWPHKQPSHECYIAAEMAVAGRKSEWSYQKRSPFIWLVAGILILWALASAIPHSNKAKVQFPVSEESFKVLADKGGWVKLPPCNGENRGWEWDQQKKGYVCAQKLPEGDCLLRAIPFGWTPGTQAEVERH